VPSDYKEVKKMALWGRKEENKYNRFIRQKIREAREEKEMSQEELAKAIDRSRITITNIENGRTEINAVDLMGIAYVLEKPVRYFYPQYVPTEGDLSSEEWELIHYFRKIGNKAMEKLLIDQARKFAEISTEADLEVYRQEVAAEKLAREKTKKK
jgi:transcriptional regulator with XRE-family HTH domain